MFTYPNVNTSTSKWNHKNELLIHIDKNKIKMASYFDIQSIWAKTS